MVAVYDTLLVSIGAARAALRLRLEPSEPIEVELGAG
jgi:hypothetical protein